MSGAGGRGCQPLEAKNVAALSGDDFNALFDPLSQRAGIIQFDQDSAALDPNDTKLLDQMFADQRGASWFFVVSRSSPEGSAEHNRSLSQERGNAVLAHLRETFDDPDLDKEVGLLWLGEEFAQLDKDYCTWTRSGSAECSKADLNRSAFVAWIDCRL
jgi:outer membrane protein OmpA-like peptidoglycan-associated protein